MPLYDYRCTKCDVVFEVRKAMRDPSPDTCPSCGATGGIGRVFGSPNVTYAGRPPWTYNDFVKYKTCQQDDGPRVKIDPSKHGDIGAWNCPGELARPSAADAKREKRKKDILAKGGYMSDAKKPG